MGSRKYDYDVAALAFYSATGITDTTQKIAINNLVKAAKAHGWWSLCTCIYPMVGGSSSTHAVNLKSPGTYNLTFNGSWTHSSTGSKGDGSTAYADTGLAGNSFGQFDHHISCYVRVAGTNSCSHGSLDIVLSTRASNSALYETNNSTSYPAFFNFADRPGWYFGARRSSTNCELYKNGTSASLATGTETGSLSSYTLYFGANNFGGTTLNYSDEDVSFFTIGSGSGFTDAIVELMYQDIHQFQLALSREIYDNAVDTFISAASITDNTQKYALNVLLSSARTGDWWNDAVAIYPIVGGTSTAHSYNLKSTVQFQLTFNGSWTHSSGGMEGDGSTAYAQTGIVPSTDLQNDDKYIAIYNTKNSNPSGTVIDAGVSTAGKGLYITVRANSASQGYTDSSTVNVYSAASYTGGLVQINRLSMSDFKLFLNDTEAHSNTTTETAYDQTAEIYIGAANSAGPIGYSDKKYAFIALGAGMSNTKQARFYKDVQRYQTILGRQV